MPKLKTNRGAAKRFKRTAKGGFKHRSAFRNHILTKKAAGRKRKLRGLAMVHCTNVKSVQELIGK